CPTNPTSLRQLIIQTVTKYCSKQDNQLPNTTTLVQSFFINGTDTPNSSLLKGLIPENIQTIMSIHNKTFIKILHKISINIYKQIWLERCKGIHQNRPLTNIFIAITLTHPTTQSISTTKYNT
ncbi:23942_t:CDS:1, partial [Racocetra persica]